MLKTSRLGGGPLLLALVVTAAYATYVVWRLSLAGWDPSTFIIAGSPAADPNRTYPNLHVFPPGTSYDGQFYYRLALNPWTHQQTAFGITLDEGAYRQQRIVYPLVAWLISAGQWQLTPTALIVTNLLAVATLTYTLGAFAQGLGRGVLAAVAAPLYPGYLVTMSRDLVELTEAALLGATLVLLQRHRYRAATAALVAGVLARETALVLPLAGLILWGYRRVRHQSECGPPVYVWLAPLMAYAAWFALLVGVWGANGLDHGGYINLGPPFEGLVQHIQSLNPATTPVWDSDLVDLALVVAAFLALVAVYRWQVLTASALSLACVLCALAAPLYSIYVWRDEWAFLRALNELFLTAAVALLARGVWSTRMLGTATLAAWIWFIVRNAATP